MPLTRSASEMALRRLHAKIANHAGEIAELVKPGAKVTVLIRNPDLDDADVLVTDDQIDSAITALGRLKAKEERKLKPEDVIANALDR